MTAKGTERSLRVGCVLMASGASLRFGEENKLLAELQGRPLVAHVLSTLRALLQASPRSACTEPSAIDAASVRPPHDITASDALFSVSLLPVVVCEDAEVNRLAQAAGFDTLCAPHPLQSDTVRDGLSYLLSSHAPPGGAPDTVPADSAGDSPAGSHAAALDGCMFVAADQPFLAAESILRLLAQFAAEPSRPCRLAYRAPSSAGNNTARADLEPATAGPDTAHAGDRITPGNPVIFPAAMFDALLSLTGDHGGGTLLKDKKPAFVFVPDKRELLDIDTPADFDLF